MKSLITLFFLLVATQVYSADTKISMHTNFGTIVIQLDAEKAPKTVANFLRYTKEGFYDNTIFHRVINNFMIQGGGFTTTNQKKDTHAAIRNEANNGLQNVRGSIAMARTGEPHSATAQFFINVKDNGFLNYTAETTRGWGYAVFGTVITGMDVVDNIKTTKTGRNDKPTKPVIIEKISIIQ